MAAAKPQLSFFGHLAIQAGFVTLEQIQECASLQLECEQRGETVPRLGELLVTNGYMTEEQVQEVLRLQKEKAPAARATPTDLEMELGAGEILFRENDDSHHDLFILLEGAVELSKSGVPISRYDQKGSFLGEIETLLGVPRLATARTLSRCRLYRIPKANVDSFFRSKPAMSLRLSEVLAERLHASITEHVRVKSGSDVQRADGEAPLLRLGDLASLTGTDEAPRIAEIRRPGTVFVNGEPAAEAAPLRDGDRLQVGRLLLRLFLEHPDLEALPDAADAEETAPSETDVADGAAFEDLPPPPPPPSELADPDASVVEAVDAQLEALADKPLEEPVRKAVAEHLRIHAELDALEEKRKALEEREGAQDDVKSELDRQRRETERVPALEALRTGLEKIEQRLAPPAPEPEPETSREAIGDGFDEEFDDFEESPPPAEKPPDLSSAMRSAYELAAEQKRILLRRAEATPALLATCATQAVEEPLYRILAKLACAPERLFGWAVLGLALEEVSEAQRKRQKVFQAKRETQEQKKSGLFGLGGRSKEEERQKEIASLEEQEGAAKILLRNAGRELRLNEKAMANAFWTAYEAAALKLVEGVEDGDAPYLRAFLRWGLLGCAPRYLEREKARALLHACSRGCLEPVFRLDAQHVLYADEAIELAAAGKIPQSPNEDLELNHRNSPEWKADRAWRRGINCRVQQELFHQILDDLQRRAAEQRELQREAEAKLEGIRPRDPKRKEKRTAFRAEIQARKVEAGRYERLAEKIRTDTLPRQAEEAEMAHRSLTESGIMLSPAGIVRHEVSVMRRSARLVARLKEPFLPFVLRDTYAPERRNVNDRETVRAALADAESRDPLLFREPLVPVNKKAHRYLVRYAPIVVLAPAAGQLGFLMAPRGGLESGRFVLPAYLQHGASRDEVVWNTLSDFRYDTSKASAGVDVMNSDTLVAAYGEVRWNMRKKDKEVRQKAAIYTEENERTNWRRHYALYMKSAHESGKQLFYKCPELYELIVGKYVDLPEGCEILKRG